MVQHVIKTSLADSYEAQIRWTGDIRGLGSFNMWVSCGRVKHWERRDRKYELISLYLVNYGCLMRSSG